MFHFSHTVTHGSEGITFCPKCGLCECHNPERIQLPCSAMKAGEIEDLEWAMHVPLLKEVRLSEKTLYLLHPSHLFSTYNRDGVHKEAFNRCIKCGLCPCHAKVDMTLECSGPENG